MALLPTIQTGSYRMNHLAESLFLVENLDAFPLNTEPLTLSRDERTCNDDKLG